MRGFEKLQRHHDVSTIPERCFPDCTSTNSRPLPWRTHHGSHVPQAKARRAQKRLERSGRALIQAFESLPQLEKKKKGFLQNFLSTAIATDLGFDVSYKKEFSRKLKEYSDGKFEIAEKKEKLEDKTLDFIYEHETTKGHLPSYRDIGRFAAITAQEMNFTTKTKFSTGWVQSVLQKYRDRQGSVQQATVVHVQNQQVKPKSGVAEGFVRRTAFQPQSMQAGNTAGSKSQCTNIRDLPQCEPRGGSEFLPARGPIPASTGNFMNLKPSSEGTTATIRAPTTQRHDGSRVAPSRNFHEIPYDALDFQRFLSADAPRVARASYLASDTSRNTPTQLSCPVYHAPEWHRDGMVPNAHSLTSSSNHDSAESGATISGSDAIDELALNYESEDPVDSLDFELFDEGPSHSEVPGGVNRCAEGNPSIACTRTLTLKSTTFIQTPKLLENEETVAWTEETQEDGEGRVALPPTYFRSSHSPVTQQGNPSNRLQNGTAILEASEPDTGTEVDQVGDETLSSFSSLGFGRSDESTSHVEGSHFSGSPSNGMYSASLGTFSQSSASRNRSTKQSSEGSSGPHGLFDMTFGRGRMPGSDINQGSGRAGGKYSHMELSTTS